MFVIGCIVNVYTYIDIHSQTHIHTQFLGWKSILCYEINTVARLWLRQISKYT
jgi:hypothetical protein